MRSGNVPPRQAQPRRGGARTRPDTVRYRNVSQTLVQQQTARPAPVSVSAESASDREGGPDAARWAGGKTDGREGGKTDGRALTPGPKGRSLRSDDREALAALEAAQLENLAATAGGHAGAEADLAGALQLMWTKGRLHKENRRGRSPYDGVSRPVRETGAPDTAQSPSSAAIHCVRCVHAVHPRWTPWTRWTAWTAWTGSTGPGYAKKPPGWARRLERDVRLPQQPQRPQKEALMPSE